MQEDIGHRSAPLLWINGDVLHEICKAVLSVWKPTSSTAKDRDIVSLQSLASTCKHLRLALAPQIFRNIRIHISEVDTEWQKVALEVRTLHRCMLAREHVRRCVLEIYCGRTQDLYEDAPLPEMLGPPSPEIPAELATLVHGMERLEVLVLALPTGHILPFRKAFKDKAVTLPSAKTLALGPGMEWLVPLCPNITTLVTQKGPQWTQMPVDCEGQSVRDLLSAASKAEKLERLELTIPFENWTVQIVQQAVPEIPELLLSNDHGDRMLFSRTATMRLDPDLLSTLGKFSRLRHLEIPGISETPQWPWCGNAFDGPEGQQYYESLVRQTEEANRKAATDISAACPKLQTLWVAWDSAWRVERDEGGAVRGVQEDASLPKTRAI